MIVDNQSLVEKTEVVYYVHLIVEKSFTSWGYQLEDVYSIILKKNPQLKTDNTNNILDLVI